MRRLSLLSPLLLVGTYVTCASLVVVEQTLHTRHRPPAGQRHSEVPARLEEAAAALRAATVDKQPSREYLNGFPSYS